MSSQHRLGPAVLVSLVLGTLCILTGWLVQSSRNGVDGISAALDSTVGSERARNGNHESVPLIAVQPQFWVKTYSSDTDAWVSDMIASADSGLVLVGATNGFGPSAEASIIQLNGSGDIVWQRSYFLGVFRSITGMGDGGYVVAGGDEKGVAHLLRFDALGQIVWHRVFSGTSAGLINSVAATTDHGVIIAGVSVADSTPSGDRNAWVVKLDAEGGILWQKEYGVFSASGNCCSDEAVMVRQTNDGDFALTGTSDTFGNYFLNGWVMKLDHDGTILWQRLYENINGIGALSIFQTRDGGYLLNTSGDLIRLDQAGAIVWQKNYDIFASHSTIELNDGGYVLAGETSFASNNNATDAVLMRLDASGNVLWSRSYDFGQFDSATSIVATADGGYAVAVSSITSGAHEKIAVLKASGDGGLGSTCAVGASHPLTGTNSTLSVIDINAGTRPSDFSTLTTTTTISTTALVSNTSCALTLPIQSYFPFVAK